LYICVGSTQPSNVRAVARNVVALEGQKVDLRCITSFRNVLRWTFNGVNLVDEGENLIKFKPVSLNHSLTILNARAEHSGEYNCHIVGTDVKAITFLTVKTGLCFYFCFIFEQHLQLIAHQALLVGWFGRAKKLEALHFNDAQTYMRIFVLECLFQEHAM